MSSLDVSSFPDNIQLPVEEARADSGHIRSRKRRLFGSLIGGSKDVAQLLRVSRRRASEASVQVVAPEPEPQAVLDLRSSDVPLAAPTRYSHTSGERVALSLALTSSPTDRVRLPRDNPVSKSAEELSPPTPVAGDFPEKNHVKESIKVSMRPSGARTHGSECSTEAESHYPGITSFAHTQRTGLGAQA